MRTFKRTLSPMSVALSAVAVMAFSVPAYAGFIDDTSPPPVAHPVVAAKAPASEVKAEPADAVFVGANAQGWNLRAPPIPGARGTVGLMRAIVMLLPPDMSGVRISLLAVDPEMQVSWSDSETRLAAFEGLLKSRGLRAELRGQSLKISPAAIGARPGGVKTVVPVMQPIPVWTIETNQPISTALEAWAKSVGWKVVWQSPKDWLMPNTLRVKGDFLTAANQVIEDLSANGADVRADPHLANKVFVVHAAGQGD